ncbi:unnamed protein product [Eruca vesicaria subsp. sativa]|uniref:Uncharacterized protein n=1 Tax=Eruca vesicaria subsp. sativa TaxID=29727 RepID=A0ABC8K7K5_ERUVS|nr:unnamed protein product [Eruca vesicaria subsp. sativa]
MNQEEGELVQNGEGRCPRKSLSGIEEKTIPGYKNVTYKEAAAEKEMQFIDKTVDTGAHPPTLPNNNFVKTLERKGYLYGSMMALLMGIVGVMRLTKNMPRKANVYPDGVTVLPTQEYMAMVKKMTDLEEKCKSMEAAQVAVSMEREKVLDAALRRALDETMTRQHEIMAYIEKKKKKKRKFIFF